MVRSGKFRNSRKESVSALLLVFLCLLSSSAFAALPPDALSDPAQEARARALQKEFRCVVCQGQSLDDSNAPLAADLRHLIRQKIAAGASDDAIKDFLVARYGDFILMKPPLDESTYILWFTPLAVLIVGGGIATWIVWKARKRPQ
jgi:cytochrome c-type biogenesis protein CcmH